MLTIDIYHQQFAEPFKKLQQQLNNLHPVLDEIGYSLENIVRGRFETQSDPLGHPWAAHKPSTAKSYPKDGNRRVLDRYGDMLGSLNYQINPASNTIQLGFGVDYAAYHEWGADNKNMQRRGMLTANPDTGELAPSDVDLVMGILNRHLFE